jgi:hypothetical protein
MSLIVFLIHGVDKSEHLVTMQVTMNEVLVIKESPDRAVLYYSRDALRDVQLQLVRLQLSPPTFSVGTGGNVAHETPKSSTAHRHLNVSNMVVEFKTPHNTAQHQQLPVK